MNLVQTSVDYIRAVRNQDFDATENIRDQISESSTQTILDSLRTDSEKKAFWCNMYNARVREQIKKSNPDLTSSISRLIFFYRTSVSVAGNRLSLQSIEHAILRCGQLSFTLGYLSRPILRELKRNLQPSSIDLRIHFLLNCGAKSCPIVRPVTGESYDEVADELTEQYIDQNVQYDDGTLQVPRIFLWYRGDFGGRNGIINFVNKYSDREYDYDANISHSQYDWRTSDESFMN